MTKANGAPLVVFESVDKVYDGMTKVVDDLNLRIEQGEFLTLLGPSGSGKTTTLMMLAGFEAPTKGNILFDGAPLNNVPTYKRDFGIVFQNYALFPHMTVAENLAFPLRMRRIGKSDIEARVQRTLSMVKLDALKDRMPTQLSGGQQQRVALARALVFEPRMVLMDEPLGALDKQLREHMQLEIKRLHEELGIAMLYVTHDQSEALTMSDRIAVFDEGRIQQIGPPRDVYARPQTTFVASFMGENNRLDGTVNATQGRDVSVQMNANGPPIRAMQAGDAVQAGEMVTLMVRPESIRISHADGADNSFDGRIEEVVYHGDHVRLGIAVDGVGTLVARHPVSEAGTEFTPGDTVPVSWSAQQMHAFAGSSPSNPSNGD
ncbi:ABC transporter ATP-binding protein [Pseudohalocynthiibacter aestuariivivens]|nr:ABC transporter ATP-binding protein [Pseudohalocynthiibacter aestuariivivens]QIE44997.1 ABC transporter ATP-binding protein [Pseudohalocynthiibacter aestuariivivens]